MEKALIIGVIVLPILMFLAFFGTNAMDYFSDSSESAVEARDGLKESASKENF